MTRVAVIGSTGQLGTDLVDTFRQAGGVHVIPLSHAEIECTDAASVRAGLEAAHPDVVINCAAMVRVDQCEDEPEQALRVNALGALHVARACAELGAACVYTSTDYVFSGDKPEAYTEDDRPHPVNVYGISKLAGEESVRAYCSDHLIVRSSGLYGLVASRAKGNFVERMIALARAGERIRVVDDQTVSPTYTRDLAGAIAGLLRHHARGLYHVSNAGRCSWYRFALEIFRLTKLRAEIAPVTSAEFGARARRPRNSALDSIRREETPIAGLRPWIEALGEYLAARGHAW